MQAASDPNVVQQAAQQPYVNKDKPEAPRPLMTFNDFKTIQSAYDEAQVAYRENYVTHGRVMDPLKLCKTMFYAGLFLNCKQATQEDTVTSAVNQIDAIVECQELAKDERLIEMFKYFSG